MIYLLAALLLILTGCGSHKMLAASTDRQTTDSVVIRETVRDTVVTVEADSALIRALVECDSLGQAHLRQLLEYQAGDRLKPPRVAIKNNVLTATAKIDSLAIYMQLKDRYQEAVKRETMTVTQYVETNKLTWWQALFHRLGIITAIVVPLLAGFKIYKLIKR